MVWGIFVYLQSNYLILFKMNKRLTILLMMTVLCLGIQAQRVNLND